MPEEIDIPKVPLSRTEQYLTKIVKELSGSDEEVEIPKTTLSRVEMYLKAIIDLLAEAAVKKPITVKGTVESKEELEEIKDAVIGDLYFVKTEDPENTDEYIKTENGWDKIGGTGVDLSNYLTADDIRAPLTNKFGIVDDDIIQLQADQESIEIDLENNYVKKTDFSTSSNAGVVRVESTFGLKMNGGGYIGINHPDDITLQNSQYLWNSTAVTIDRIVPMFKYFGLQDSKDKLITAKTFSSEYNIGFTHVLFGETSNITIENGGIFTVTQTKSNQRFFLGLQMIKDDGYVDESVYVDLKLINKYSRDAGATLQYKIFVHDMDTGAIKSGYKKENARFYAYGIDDWLYKDSSLPQLTN